MAHRYFQQIPPKFHESKDLFPDCMACAARQFRLRFPEAGGIGMPFRARASDPKPGGRCSRGRRGLVKLRKMWNHYVTVRTDSQTTQRLQGSGSGSAAALDGRSCRICDERQAETGQHLKHQNESAARSPTSCTGALVPRTDSGTSVRGAIQTNGVPMGLTNPPTKPIRNRWNFSITIASARNQRLDYTDSAKWVSMTYGT